MISINLEVIEKHIKRSKKFVAFIYDNLIFPLFWDYIHNLFIWVYSKTFFNINKLSKLNFTKKHGVSFPRTIVKELSSVKTIMARQKTSEKISFGAFRSLFGII